MFRYVSHKLMQLVKGVPVCLMQLVMDGHVSVYMRPITDAIGAGSLNVPVSPSDETGDGMPCSAMRRIN